MNTNLEWNDLKTILAIARAGSLSGAGRLLKVSHATVFRRLGHIEDRLGVRLFDRLPGGYLPTPAGEAAVGTAERLETEVQQLESQIIGRDMRPSGTVNVTTTDTLYFSMLSSVFSKFCRAYPGIDLNIVVSNDSLDLSRHEADIAIRPTLTPPEFLIGRKLGVIQQAVYCHKNIEHQPPGRSGEPEHPAWVGPDKSMSYQALKQWMQDNGLNTRIRMHVNSVLGMYAAVRDQMGLAVLPIYLASQDNMLKRCSKPISALAVDLWLLSPTSLRKTARVRALTSFVTDEVTHQLQQLNGPLGHGVGSLIKWNE